MTAGISPTVVTGLAAILTEMESQEQAPLMTLTITSAFPGFSRYMMFRNGVWSGHDLAHHFTEDRSSISFSPTNRGVEQDQPSRVTTPLTSASTAPLNLPLGYAAGPTGSHTPTLPHQLPATAGCSVSEHAVLAALTRTMTTSCQQSGANGRDFKNTSIQVDPPGINRQPPIQVVAVPH